MNKSDATVVLIVKHMANVSHLETALSYAWYLKEQGYRVKAYFSFCGTIWEKKLVSHETLGRYALPDDIVVVYGTDKQQIVKENAPIHIGYFGRLSARNRLDAFRYERFETFVGFDEGSGSWQRWTEWLRIGMQERVHKGESVISYTVKKTLSSLVGMLPFCNRKSWRWSVDNEENEIARYLPKVYASKRIFEKLPLYKDETWILLTGGFVESGYVDAVDYVKWLESVVEKIRKPGVHIIVKAHPAEDIEKYASIEGIETINPSESIESMLCDEAYRHYKIVGEYSTALVTLAAMYGMQTYYVASLVDRKITGRFAKLWHTYVKPFEEGLDAN